MMNFVKRIGWLLLGLMALLSLFVSVANAQQERGSIRGAVYQDVNGDGQCVNTGIGGENPVEGIPIEFTSSDGETVVTLQTGSDGTYGLVAAGQSYWQVMAKPNAVDWVVTSENPLYAPVFPEDGLIQTGYNFCVSKGANAVIVLPESGATAVSYYSLWLMAAVAFGGGLFLVGATLEWRRRNQIS